MMQRNSRSIFAAALLGLTACGDALATKNFNNPDVATVLRDAISIEAAVAGLGSQLNNTLRASESVNTQAKILADETFASVANFGMAARDANRSLISNELGNDNQVGNLANFNALHRAQRQAFNAMSAYATFKSNGGAALASGAENRLRAFAYLIAGQSVGYLSFAYDSVAVGYEGMSLTEIPALISAKAANVKALEFLDSAVVIANRGMTSLPAAWLSQTATVSQATFVQIARSYRARIRAGVARTPAERVAVDWVKVIDDATNGITADLNIQINGTTGWSAGFDAGQIYVAGGWHQVPMAYVGMADISGAYQNWMALPATAKTAFTVVTPDKRWPAGATRAAQQAFNTSNILPAGQYLRNRASGDVVISGNGGSFYDHRRFGQVVANTSIAGTYTDMSKAEIDLLRAEGLIRTGNPAAAVTLVNISRVRAGLAPVTVDGAPPNTAGGTDCVPKMRDFTCASLLEALKYEKRMETAFTGYMIWFSDSRGWGDLRQNTVIEWPVPYQEMQARVSPYYNGTNRQTALSTYGF